MTCYNFSPGPAVLPDSVKQQISRDCIQWEHYGCSILEVSHRNPVFLKLKQEAEQRLRDLLNIPDHYDILFLHGGGRGMFSAIPMNLLGSQQQADYWVTGHWSEQAYKEACQFGTIRLIELDQGYPRVNDVEHSSEAQYVHLCSNETVDGRRFPQPWPDHHTLVCDMSSDILTQNIDVEAFGMIYACTQKNLGVPGVSIAIIRDDLLHHCQRPVPMIWDFLKQKETGSLVNTVNTFAIYVLNLLLRWIDEQGGVEVMQDLTQRKSQCLYDFIDQSDFYYNTVPQVIRSWVNVVFNLADPSLEAHFLKQAEQNNLLHLKGHAVKGGLRASLYNAMSMAGVERLIEFMQWFEDHNT